MKPVVIYHANCFDGMAAAWCVRQALGEVEMYAGYYGAEPRYANLKDKDVVIVDFSFPKDQMEAIDAVANTLIVLDHHASAERDCADLDYCVFDMERSGAGLAWDHFHGKDSRPEWINYVEDSDLWHFNYPGTKLFMSYMSSFPISLENCDMYDRLSMESMMEDGDAIKRYVDLGVSIMIKEARLYSIDHHMVAILNVPYQFASKAAGKLLDMPQFAVADYALCWFATYLGEYQCSLRSRKGGVDVSNIAAKFGGGGHVSAAGYTGKCLPWKAYNE